MDSKKAHACAQRLIDTGKMGTWKVDTLAIWLESGCRCAYCGRSLLEDRGMAYFFYQLDHLLPKRKYPYLVDANSNLVLACSSCNGLKLRFDPGAEVPINVAASRKSLNADERRKLIAAAKEFLAQGHRSREEQFAIERQLILDCLAGE